LAPRKRIPWLQGSAGRDSQIGVSGTKDGGKGELLFKERREVEYVERLLVLKVYGCDVLVSSA